VPQCALAIEDIIRRAGFPDGSFQTLLIPPGQVQRVLDDPRVAAVSLTGSEQAGRNIAAAAGRQIKKAVLELGGSDPFIVMPSADMPAAIDTAVKGRIVNSGQSCIAANRIYVQRGVYEPFLKTFVERTRALKVGNGLEPDVQIGPLIDEAGLAKALAKRIAQPGFEAMYWASAGSPSWGGHRMSGGSGHRSRS